MIAFFAPGIPRAMQTGKVVTTGDGRSFPVRRHTEWGSYVALVASQHRPEALLCGPLAVRLVFHLPAPKQRKRVLPITRPDVCNLQKGVVDAMNGVLWVDDSQVVELVVAKVYAGARGPGLDVEVEEVSDLPRAATGMQIALGA